MSNSIARASGMTYVKSVHYAAWEPIFAGVVQTFRPGTPIFFAAVRLRLGLDPGGAKFLKLAAWLPPRAQDRLWDSVKKHRGKASGSACLRAPTCAAVAPDNLN